MRLRCCLLLLAALSVSAQEYREQVTVDIVEVPVHVTRRGKAVTGLTADAFELSINGKPHPIEYFDVVDARGAALPLVAGSVLGGDVPPEPPRAERRNLTVLVFDTAATTYRYIQRASEAAQKFVKEAPQSETFAVARLNADGVRFLVPFTQDRVAVLRAVRTLEPSKARDALGLVVLDVERKLTVGDTALAATQTLGDVAAGYGGMSGRASEATARVIAARDRANREILTGNEIRAAEYLGLLADSLAAINGMKHVILFAEGGRRMAEPKSAARMHAKFQAASVILDAVELEGMVIPGFGDVESREMSTTFRKQMERSDALYALALGTGGTVTQHSDIVAGLRLLREIQGLTYILAFRPPRTARDHNDISVKVKNQPFGTTVTYRRGYSTSGARPKRNESLFLADVMANDVPQRGLTLDVRVAPVDAGTNVILSVPGRELLAREVDGPQAEVDVFLYVFNDRNVVVEWAYWRLMIDLEKGRTYLEDFPYEIERIFSTLGGGRHTAKALIRFVNSDVIAFQRTDFEIAAK